ncbi:MAG: hypothetical protein CK426_08135 [Legionella sp.]|nr:MAG: hypothetical protein CK423_01040 [Legionella sp.]PJD97399.1 MAG: hypothetical protein CK426_08135 [Legionella sp.]
MTIFIDALKSLIKEKLSSAIKIESKKSQGNLLLGVGCNHQLSAGQKNILIALDNAIVRYDSTDDDAHDVVQIVGLIKKASSDIRTLREEHKKGTEGSDALRYLSELAENSEQFYTKLNDFSFNLLNRPYQKTPQYEIYYQACYYFGQEVFQPKAHDREIRTDKERCLAIRLTQLEELIRPEYTLKEQQERAVQVLNDMFTDNKKIIRSTSESRYALPGISVAGIQLTSAPEWFSARSGRFKEVFSIALHQIQKMTPDTSDCPLSEEPDHQSLGC